MDLINWAAITPLGILLSVTTAGHALFNKHTPASALGWVAVCLVFPFFGPTLYFFFGINRVQTRARRLEDKFQAFQIDLREYSNAVALATIRPSELDLSNAHLQIARISEKVTGLPLVGGNRIDPLHNGETAFPAMLEAIASAQKRLFLATYIFDTSPTGKRFIDALGDAVDRGVDVRVIIDGIGELHSLTRAGAKLIQKGVRTARFLPPKLIPPSVHINLRNHRKLLIADGQVAFTGGMNIGDRHLADNIENPSRVIDVHFRVMGPIVMQLERTFIEDWSFCTGEQTSALSSLPVKQGSAVCRAILDGPNEDINKLSTILIGAISSARERILIMTPYFLPPSEIVSALKIAALRGIDVRIALPGKNNLPYIQWAADHMLSDLLKWGIKIFFHPPPFVHSKLLVIDDVYAQIGSANLDPRSLRLNFELMVEIFDIHLVQSLADHITEKIINAYETDSEAFANRSLPVKIRDALAWLFSPYL
jgi:cardiolipin synthase A/B